MYVCMHTEVVLIPLTWIGFLCPLKQRIPAVVFCQKEEVLLIHLHLFFLTQTMRRKQEAVETIESN